MSQRSSTVKNRQKWRPCRHSRMHSRKRINRNTHALRSWPERATRIFNADRVRPYARTRNFISDSTRECGKWTSLAVADANLHHAPAEPGHVPRLDPCPVQGRSRTSRRFRKKGPGFHRGPVSQSSTASRCDQVVDAFDGADARLTACASPSCSRPRSRCRHARRCSTWRRRSGC